MYLLDIPVVPINYEKHDMYTTILVYGLLFTVGWVPPPPTDTQIWVKRHRRPRVKIAMELNSAIIKAGKESS